MTAEAMASRRAFPVMLLAAALALVRAAEDFPMLLNVVFDLCGAERFNLAPSSPCPFTIFGFSVAWSECSSSYGTAWPQFSTCLAGCVNRKSCDRVCGEVNVTSEHCHAECNKATDCVQLAMREATGQVSAESFVRQCFSTNPGTAVGTSLLSAAAARRAGAGVRTEAGGATRLRGRITATPGAVDLVGNCSCDDTGTVRGTATGQAGCAAHGQEGMAATEQ